MSIYYRSSSTDEWTLDRECYGTKQDARRIAKLRSQGYEVKVRVDDIAEGDVVHVLREHLGD